MDDLAAWKWLQAELQKPPDQQDPRAAKVKQHFDAQTPQQPPGTPPQGLAMPAGWAKPYPDMDAGLGPVSVRKQLAAKGIGNVVGVAAPVAGYTLGAMSPVPGGAALGSALGNVAGGAFERAIGSRDSTGSTGLDVGIDAALGAAPVALSKAAGAGLRAIGNPRLAKAVGFLLGKPTGQAVAEGGTSLDYATQNQLENIIGADTAQGSRNIAKSYLPQAQKDLNNLVHFNGTITTPPPPPGPLEVLNGRAPEPVVTDMLHRPSPMTVGQQADIGSNLGAYAADPGRLSSAVAKLLGTDPSAARYLSAVAQAKARNLFVAPEIEQMLKAVPGQGMAMPTVTSLIREYSQNN